jgi:hypothetical protein
MLEHIQSRVPSSALDGENVKSADLNRDNAVAHLLRNFAINHIGNSRPEVDYVIDSIETASTEPYSAMAGQPRRALADRSADPVCKQSALVIYGINYF